jgi:peptidylprolyl isomerase
MLDEKHVVFGYVCDGYDVVDAINNVGSPSGRPKVDVIIADCGVLEGFDFELPSTPKSDDD